MVSVEWAQGFNIGMGRTVVHQLLLTLGHSGTTCSSSLDAPDGKRRATAKVAEAALF